MANIPVPEQFNFDDPESWGMWCKRFTRYMSVGELNKKTDAEQIDILLYVMGQKGESILLQMKETPKTLKTALEAFAKYFAPRTNVIFERFKFNTRKQNPGEPIDAYITDLHTIAERCQFGQLKEELIRDRIVVGITDIRASEAMQLKSDLTLQSATEMVRQSERQQIENQIIRKKEAPINYVSGVGDCRKHQSQRQPQQRQHIQQQKQQQTKNLEKVCFFCSQPYHNRDVCPAKNAICHNCGIKGHYKNSCKSVNVNNRNFKNNTDTKKRVYNNKVNHVISEKECQVETNYVDSFIGHILCRSSETEDWQVDCHIQEFSTTVTFLIDTGASNVSLPEHLVPKQFFEQLNTNSMASGPDGSPLEVLGSLNLTLSYNSLSGKCLVYVIKNLRIPLLGREAIKLLKVLQPPPSSVEINSTRCSTQQNSLDIAKQYPTIFNEMGLFKGEVSIKLKDNSKPYVQSVPRPVPIPYMNKLKNEIDRLIRLQIIQPMQDVTDWVSPIVVVPKDDKEIRLCVDYTKLNESVGRPYYPIPRIEATLANLKGARYFSKIDVNKGFYQIKLDKQSQLLTCFITPFGRYIFTRLPFGISCAPEYFVSKYAQVLRDIENTASHIDDLLIYGHTKEEHDKILHMVLKRLSDEGITINQSKSVFGVQQVKWLGHVLSGKGVSIDPDRVEAIKRFPVPENKSQLLRFLGIVNFIGKFIQNKSNLLEPLNNLLKNNTTYQWTTLQNNAFEQLKKVICEVPVLAFYDPSKNIIISADASSYGIGSCLVQADKSGNREIVAYISRTMTQTESHYAQIEREALGLTWAAEKFSDYITGIYITLETDHKPLVQILQTKNLDTLTPRLQRFRMRLMRYNYRVVYVPGKTLVVADALSRSPLTHNCEDEELSLEVDKYINNITATLPVMNEYLERIKQAQQEDKICKLLEKYTFDGWPDRSAISDELLPYYQYRSDISCLQNLLLKGTRIIIPAPLQKQVIDFIHAGHQGITKCRRRAQLSVWWIGLSTQLENLIRNCPNCVEERTNIKEPLLREDFPTRPMQKVAVDLFKHKHWYVIITDYYSRFFEIFPLQSSLTEDVIISKLKQYFSRYGICDRLRSDNGPQFKMKFKEFASNYNFIHETSSPYYSQSNGAVEAAVKTAKRLIKMNEDIDLALLNYRATPLANGFSPGELMMGRRLRSHVPIHPNLLEVTNGKEVVAIENKLKSKLEINYNKRHRVKDLPKLKKGDAVWIVDLRIYGTVLKRLSEARSYLIETNQGKFRRNRWHLIQAPYKQSNLFNETEYINPLLQTATSNIENCQNQNDNVRNVQSNENQNVNDEIQIGIRKSLRSSRHPVWMSDYVNK